MNELPELKGPPWGRVVPLGKFPRFLTFPSREILRNLVFKPELRIPHAS